MSNAKTALVLGATGGIGGETAAALIRHGWQVVGMTRDPAKARAQAPTSLAAVIWVSGDAMNAADVRQAAEGVQVIVHAVNPPGYHNWGGLVLPMVDNTIAAAKAVGARVVLPGTVYNYGYDVFPDLDEDSPQHPVSEKGKIRVELERRLEAASRDGAPALIVRFGDFFGPAAGNNWFSQGMIRPGHRLGSINYPGKKGVGHAWAYLPDAGETIARLLDRMGELDRFARFHFAGTWDADGTALTRAIAKGVGRPETRVNAVPWALIAAFGLFQETMRELFKMRYLWRNSIRLDNAKLVAFLGEEPHTPIEEAVRTALKAQNVT